MKIAMLFTLLFVLGSVPICSGISKQLKTKFYNIQVRDQDMKGVETVHKIQFLDFKESVFSDFGEGIAVEDWDEFIDSLSDVHSIPKEGQEYLKGFKSLNKRATHTQTFELGKAGTGNFGFLRIGVEKDYYGKLNFLIAGTQIRFDLGLIQAEKSMLESIFSRITGSDGKEELILNSNAKNDLQDYFMTNALNSAKRFDVTFENDEL